MVLLDCAHSVVITHDMHEKQCVWFIITWFMRGFVGRYLDFHFSCSDSPVKKAVQ
jgi:hypothetical protein